MNSLTKQKIPTHKYRYIIAISLGLGEPSQFLKYECILSIQYIKFIIGLTN